ncbi:MAG TPA: hypothetical protein VIK91_17195 [Nannocystis sp.]
MPAAARPLLAGLAAFGLARAARAELPRPQDFDATHWVTDAEGAKSRMMTEDDLAHFLNRARCECGQKVVTAIKAVRNPPELGTQLDAFVGRECDVAEMGPFGEYERCAVLASAPASAYLYGVESAYHPVFLAHGVALASPNRDPDDAVAAGGCEGTGVSGVWLCGQDNGLAGCQRDEFFVSPDDALSGLAGVEPLHFDFDPPAALVGDLSVEPGSGSVRLRWSLADTADLAGLRVLCEEADTGAAPGLRIATPEPTDIADGTHYFTAGNLCGAEPFSTFPFAPAPPPDAPDTCGNGLVEPGEACDDGPDNHPDGLCAPDCTLRVGARLHALAWDHLCSQHLPVDADEVIIGGLENGTAYNFVLVAHDAAGNPRALARVVTATPDASLPDLLPADAGCACATSSNEHVPFTMIFGTCMLLAARRRPRPRA